MYVIPKTPRAQGDFAPWVPYRGSVLDPLGNPKRSSDPSPTHAPLIPNPGSAPGSVVFLCLFSIVVSNTYCVVFLCLFFLCTLCCQFVSLDCPLLIAPSVFSNVYFQQVEDYKCQYINKYQIYVFFLANDDSF